MTVTDARPVIRRLVSARLKRRLALDDETPLISGGLIDSMSIIDLILDLQSELGLEIPVSEVQPDDFDSIERIAQTVARFR